MQTSATGMFQRHLCIFAQAKQPTSDADGMAQAFQSLWATTGA